MSNVCLPNVYSLPVRRPKDQLRRTVLWCKPEAMRRMEHPFTHPSCCHVCGVGPRSRQRSRESEVAELEYFGGGNKQVFRLDITVNDIMLESQRRTI
jgi:hypothetical protein